MGIIPSSKNSSSQQRAWLNIDMQSFSNIIQTIDMILLEGVVQSRCRHMTQHLVATLFKSRLYQVCKSHVTSIMHHDTWGIMQVAFQIIILSTNLVVSRRWAGRSSFSKSQPRIILLSRSLGATHCPSSLYNQICKSPCSLLHNDSALGGYTNWSVMSIRQLQVPGCCRQDNLILGATYVDHWTYDWWLRRTTCISSNLQHLY